MHLKLLTPTQVVLDTPVKQITAESIHGWFSLLEHHVDFAAPLVPSILTYKPESEKEQKIYAAIDGGTLVKCKDQVTISTKDAIFNEDLDDLAVRVADEFKLLSEEEKNVKIALLQLQGKLAKTVQELKTEK